MGRYDNEPRYINPLTDYGFKKVFGDKEVMTAFLTDLLNPTSPITDIMFLDKELFEEAKDLRGVIYDLRCHTADGKEFIVEMQNRGEENFSERILYYLSRSLSEQAKKGKSMWDFNLSPVYGVFFMNFHLKGFKPQTIRTIRMTVDETGEVFTDKMTAYTLELPDFKDRSTEYPKSAIEYWLYNLVNMENMTADLPYQAQQPVFGKVGEIAEMVNLSDEDRYRYQKTLDNLRLNLSQMRNARNEGVKEGREEGREEKSHEIAAKMKENGLPIDIIGKCTGLSAEEIARL